MTDPFQPRIGAVMSADVAVPQHEAVVSFYAKVLTTGKQPLWQADLMNSRGMPIIGLGAQSPEFADLPMQWMPHIQVVDVGHGVSQALALGGRELMHGKDDEGNSQWAVLLDPNGAAFGLVPVVTADQLPKPQDTSTPNQLTNTGHIAWLDLTCIEAAQTRDFYHQVTGWKAEAVPMKDADGSYEDFNMLGGDGQPVAGICHARGVNNNLPPVWMLYLPVGDLSASLKQLKDTEGQIIHQSKNQTNEVTQAVIQDPAGLYLTLVQG